MQLAVRTDDGTALRFGPVVRGGPEAGFQSLRITDPAGAARCADAARQAGSLVSNDHCSFRNLAGDATSAPEEVDYGDGIETEGRR